MFASPFFPAAEQLSGQSSELWSNRLYAHIPLSLCQLGQHWTQNQDEITRYPTHIEQDSIFGGWGKEEIDTKMAKAPWTAVLLHMSFLLPGCPSSSLPATLSNAQAEWCL